MQPLESIATSKPTAADVNLCIGIPGIRKRNMVNRSSVVIATAATEIGTTTPQLYSNRRASPTASARELDVFFMPTTHGEPASESLVRSGRYP